MRVSLGETMKKFRRRNLAQGVSTSEARSEQAGFDQALQETRNVGMGDTARIREEGAMNQIMAAQEFNEPYQDAATRGLELGNEDAAFSNLIASKYGEAETRKYLGLKPLETAKPTESRANVIFRDRVFPEGARPRSDISSPRFEGGGGRFRGSGASGSWGEDIPLPGEVERPTAPTTQRFKTPQVSNKPTWLESFSNLFKKKKPIHASIVTGVRG